MSDQEDLDLGMGWSGQILEGGFRGKATYFHAKDNFKDSRGIIIASLGCDYTFNNSLMLQFEGLYNGNKHSTNILSLDQLNTTNINTKNLFLSGYSMFGSASYPFTPLINCSLAGITNFRNKLFFINPTVSISLKTNLELSFIGQIVRFYGEQVIN